MNNLKKEYNLTEEIDNLQKQLILLKESINCTTIKDYKDFNDTSKILISNLGKFNGSIQL